MEDNVGRIYIINGEQKDLAELLAEDTMTGGSAYEVIRIIHGVPLFYEDHIGRMTDTLAATGRQLSIGTDQLKKDVKKLLAANQQSECNVKIVVFEREGRQNTLAYISKSYYPSAGEFRTGVKTGLLRLERNNPNAKLLNRTYKETVSARISEGGFFEVVLVDSRGRITEGSKSNAFFVSGNRILTAPGDAVLRGITRKYVFEACRNAGYEVTEEFVEESGLIEIDGAFLSGTSIKVLPIASVDKLELQSSINPVILAVRKEYDQLLEKYIDENSKIW